MLRGWRLVISLVRCRRVRGWLVNGVDRMGWIVEQPVQLVRQSQAQSHFAQNVPKHQKLKGRSWDFRSGYSDGASILKKSKPWHFKNSFQKWSIQVLARGIEHIVWSICGIFMELDPVWTFLPHLQINGSLEGPVVRMRCKSLVNNGKAELWDNSQE